MATKNKGKKKAKQTTKPQSRRKKRTAFGVTVESPAEVKTFESKAKRFTNGNVSELIRRAVTSFNGK